MALPVKKYYQGAPVSTVLTGSLNDSVGSTSVTIDSKTGWPTSFPFYAVIEPGTSREEKVKVTAISTLTLTIVRGEDNTNRYNHGAGSTIYPVFTALEASEANEIASIMTTKGDIITNDGSNISRLAVGATNTHVLQVDSTATNGIKWGQVANGGIADGAVTSAKILDGTIVAGDLAASLLKLVCPVGTIVAYPGASAPTGWLLCDGTSTSGYSELAALVGVTTPNLTGKVLVGKGSAPFNGALLSSLGSTTSTAPHTHDIDHNHAAFNWTHDHENPSFTHDHDNASYTHDHSNATYSHTHTFSVSGGTHQHDVPYSIAQLQNASDNIAAQPDGNGTVYYSTAAGGGGHSHSGTTDGANTTSIDIPSHTGSIDIPSHTGTIDIASHTGSIDIPPLGATNSGVSSAEATHGNVQPSTLVNYIIKHDYV